MRPIAICSFLLALASGLSVNGATLFTSEASFLSNAGPVELDSFETQPATAPHPSPGFAARSSGPWTITNSTDTADLAFFNQPAAVGHATHGVNYLTWYGQTSSNSVTFAFSTTVIAFGINIVDYGYPSHATPLTFSTDTGEAGVAAMAPADSDNEQFFGIVSAPFNSITFSRTELADGVIFDEMYYDLYAVPEPGTACLAGLAAMGLAALRRRK